VVFAAGEFTVNAYCREPTHRFERACNRLYGADQQPSCRVLSGAKQEINSLALRISRE
jgi:hypothetical protein